MIESGCSRDEQAPTPGTHPAVEPPAAASPPAARPTEPAPAAVPASSPARSRGAVSPAGKASSPAAATAAVSPPVPAWKPLGDAIAGEWAEYDSLDGKRIRYDVVEVKPTAVSTRITIRGGGSMWGEPATRDDEPGVDPLAREADRKSTARSCRREPIEAAGRRWSAILYEDRWTDEEIAYVRRTWVSPEVPYLGMIRMELTGDGQVEARLVLREFGRAGAANSG